MNQDFCGSDVVSSDLTVCDTFELVLVDEAEFEFVGGGTAVTCY